MQSFVSGVQEKGNIWNSGSKKLVEQIPFQ